MNTNNSNIPNIAVMAFAVCLVAIVGSLCAIAIRDGNTPLVTQAMQELVYIAGAAVVALGALLGISKYLDSQQGQATSASQPSSPATSVPALDTSGVGDVAALLAAIQQSQQSQQPAPAAAAPVAGQ